MSELEPTRTYSNPTATDELKPCPICGRQPDFQHFNITPNVQGRIVCSCGIELRQGKNDTEDDIRIIWNTRSDYAVQAENERKTEQAIAATLGATDARPTQAESSGTCKIDVLNTGDCAGYECSEYIMHCNGCGHEFGHVLYNEDGDVWMSEPPNYCPNCGRRCVW